MAVQKKKQTAPAEAGAPHRVRLTVPAEDAVTMQWLAAQSSVSASLRVLIREAMMQHGPIDALSRPLPTMPAQAAPVIASAPAPTPASAPAPTQTQTEESAPELVPDEPVQQAPARPARPVRSAAAPARRTPAPAAAAPAPEVEPEASASGISDIAAFMAASRDDD